MGFGIKRGCVFCIQPIYRMEWKFIQKKKKYDDAKERGDHPEGYS